MFSSPFFFILFLFCHTGCTYIHITNTYTSLLSIKWNHAHWLVGVCLRTRLPACQSMLGPINACLLLSINKGGLRNGKFKPPHHPSHSQLASWLTDWLHPPLFWVLLWKKRRQIYAWHDIFLFSFFLYISKCLQVEVASGRINPAQIYFMLLNPGFVCILQTPKCRRLGHKISQDSFSPFMCASFNQTQVFKGIWSLFVYITTTQRNSHSISHYAALWLQWLESDCVVTIGNSAIGSSVTMFNFFIHISHHLNCLKCVEIDFANMQNEKICKFIQLEHLPLLTCLIMKRLALLIY